MNAAGYQFFIRWWSEELVRALLWGAWKYVLNREGTVQDAAFRRFTHLVNATPCWPCFIEYIHPREQLARAMQGFAVGPCLLILSDREEIDAHLECDNREDC